MQIEYRIAGIDDLDNICSMVKAAVDTMTEQNIFQWDDLYPAREDFENDIHKRQLYIGLAEETIAVIYVLNQECDEEYRNGDWKYTDTPFYVIHRLCVNPVFQNKGIAKNTLLHIEEQLKSMGAGAVRLDVFSENPFALKLYDGLGYIRTGSAHWRKGEFYLMEKRI